tara:strand:- start:236 stop:487 length:252 start_codon:yes stop_codon:yes gene_type:complete
MPLYTILMNNNKSFFKNLNKLRSKVKERRRQELYDMINDENNKLEDKIALIKMSFKELEGKEIVNSFKDLIVTENKKEDIKKE